MRNGNHSDESTEQALVMAKRHEVRRHAMRQLLPAAVFGVVGALFIFGASFVLERQNAEAKFRELAEQMVRDMQGAIEAKSGGEFHYAVTNRDRSIGARVSGSMSKPVLAAKRTTRSMRTGSSR